LKDHWAPSSHVLTSPHPDYWLLSITSTPWFPTTCLQLTWPLSLTCQLHAQQTLTPFPCLFPRPTKPSLFGAILNSCSCLLLVYSMVGWEPSRLILSYGDPMGAKVHFYIPLPFPVPTKTSGQPISLAPGSVLVSCSAYLTLKMEVICSSETSVDFHLIFNGLHGVISQKIALFSFIIVNWNCATHVYHPVVLIKCLIQFFSLLCS
jgi:hypothetical protein